MNLKTHSNFKNYYLLPKYETEKKTPQSITYPSYINFYGLKPSFRVISKRDLQLPHAQLWANGDMPVVYAEEKWTHEIEIEVRDYELDQFGVVNNSVYAQYCEHARLTGLSSVCGLTADSFASSGAALALTELTMNFIAPLRSGDKCLVKVRPAGLSTTRLTVDHYIVKLPKQEPILKARTTNVWLNKNHRPVRIPLEVSNQIKSILTHSK